MIKRKNNPYKDCWALPGGFVEEEESLLEAAARELKEETQVENLNLIQLGTFGDPGRDPRGRVITVVYYGFVEDTVFVQAGDDAKEAKWFDVELLPETAFDHRKIIDLTILKVRL